MKIKSPGRYIIADAGISHGKPTFRGTRILVGDVLEQAANGMASEVIIEEWRGPLPKEAIAEAVSLAREALPLHLRPKHSPVRMNILSISLHYCGMVHEKMWRQKWASELT